MRIGFIVFLLLYVNMLDAQVNFQQDADLMPFVFSTIPPCVTDFNGDYLDDVLRMDADSLFISFQNSDGTFTTQQTAHNFSTNVWSVAAGELNGDQLNDFVLGTVTEVVFVLMNSDLQNISSYESVNDIFSQRSNIVDINNDGWNDAFVCHDLGLSKPFKNDGAGNLSEDQSLITTVPTLGNYSSIWFDYDDDKDLDLYVTKCVGGASPGDENRDNRLYMNDGTNQFTEVGEAANLNDNDQSWTSAIFDYDNDLDFDIFIANHEQANKLMRNNGDGTFTDVIAGSGIDAMNLGGFHAVAHDLDNNGYIDLITDLDDGIYFNNGNGTFTGTAVVNGWDFAIGDLNDDGFLDAVNAPTQYINDGNSNHYLKINLEGIVSNPNGIGARVYLYGSDGNNQTRQLWSGEGFSVMSSLNLHFGLGGFISIDSLVVEWPSGIVDHYIGIEGDQTLLIVEGNTVGLNDPVDQGDFQIHYLSDQSLLNIQMNSQDAYDFKLYDTSGNLAMMKKILNQNEMIAVDLPVGVYFYQLLLSDVPKLAGKVLIVK